jgi:hypothetical protein
MLVHTYIDEIPFDGERPVKGDHVGVDGDGQLQPLGLVLLDLEPFLQNFISD